MAQKEIKALYHRVEKGGWKRAVSGIGRISSRDPRRSERTSPLRTSYTYVYVFRGRRRVAHRLGRLMPAGVCRLDGVAGV